MAKSPKPQRSLKLCDTFYPQISARAKSFKVVVNVHLRETKNEPQGKQMEETIQQKNKDLVLKAFDTLFNKRDYVAAETFWSSKYIQHSAHIEPGREGLFNLVRSIPATLKYEPGLDRKSVV